MKLFKPNIQKMKEKNEISGLISAFKKTKDKDIRREAIHALCEICDPRSFEAAMEGLTDTDPKVRIDASSCLARLKNKNAVTKLSEALKDEVWEVRSYAAFALGEIGSKKVVEPLIDALQKEQDESVKNEIVDALAEIKSDTAIAKLMEIACQRGYPIEFKNHVIGVISKSIDSKQHFDIFKHLEPSDIYGETLGTGDDLYYAESRGIDLTINLLKLGIKTRNFELMSNMLKRRDIMTDVWECRNNYDDDRIKDTFQKYLFRRDDVEMLIFWASQSVWDEIRKRSLDTLFDIGSIEVLEDLVNRVIPTKHSSDGVPKKHLLQIRLGKSSGHFFKVTEYDTEGYNSTYSPVEQVYYTANSIASKLRLKDLLKLLDSPNIVTRSIGISALQESLDSNVRSSVRSREIKANLDQTSNSVKQGNPDLIEAIANLLKDKNLIVREIASDVICLFDKNQARLFIQRLLDNRDQLIRANAIKLLADLKDPVVVPILKEDLRSSNWISSVELLTKIANEESIYALLNIEESKLLHPVVLSAFDKLKCLERAKQQIYAAFKKYDFDAPELLGILLRSTEKAAAALLAEGIVEQIESSELVNPVVLSAFVELKCLEKVKQRISAALKQSDFDAPELLGILLRSTERDAATFLAEGIVKHLKQSELGNPVVLMWLVELKCLSKMKQDISIGLSKWKRNLMEIVKILDASCEREAVEFLIDPIIDDYLKPLKNKLKSTEWTVRREAVEKLGKLASKLGRHKAKVAETLKDFLTTEKDYELVTKAEKTLNRMKSR